ncbi:MAG: hypothetical protein AABX03_05350 [Nanoarchaeota archaeon]
MDKKERVKTLALSYYQRKDVLDAIFKFSQNREISPKYFEGFGKRPDSFQYNADILSMVKKGATSFHCSEEIWSDPLNLSVGLVGEELNELRSGWDLIIDIDCKWIDYSKKAAQAIIKALEFKGVKNAGIKFSGNKGFHIIVPWEAFPEEINGIKTKDMFPEWPRAVVSYLKELSRPILEDLIKDMKHDLEKIGGFTGIRCENCKNIAEENFLITLRCDKCYPSHIETFKSHLINYKPKKCPGCKSIMFEKEKIRFYKCNYCDLDSLSSKTNFNETIISTDLFKLLGLDLQLVSSRHLFRMPYSLHEKTGLSSIVIDKNKIDSFQIMDADPFKAKVFEFSPKPKKDEAKDLLLNSIDWQKSQVKDKKLDFTNSDNEFQTKNKEFKKIEINLKNLSEDKFPPVINRILEGMDDGKKRALFVLMNFYRSLGYPLEDVEKKINEWNTKNKPLLKQGYINAQLIWHSKHPAIMPPNFDNQIYKEIGVFAMDDLSEKTKNPVIYVARKANPYDQNKKAAKKSSKIKTKT